MAASTSDHTDADLGSHRQVANQQIDDVVAELVHGRRQGSSCYSPDQHQTLIQAGQTIIAWAVEVARYEADIDWQWSHRDDDDPTVTASALARLIRDAREVVGRAESLLVAALADGPRRS